MYTTHPHRGARLRHRDPRHGPRPGELPPGFRDLFRRGRPGGGLIRRGEIRPLILAALARRPMHGYEVIGELEATSGGRWRPSAGSVYPTLQQLADEGLVTGQDVDGRRVYTLTDSGREAAAASPAPTPWGEADRGGGELSRLAMQLMGAVMQVERVGTGRAREETTRILADARRQVYRVLAEDEVEPSAEGDAGPA